MHHTIRVDDRSTCSRQLRLRATLALSGATSTPSPCCRSHPRPPLNSLKSSFVRFHYVSLPVNRDDELLLPNLPPSFSHPRRRLPTHRHEIPGGWGILRKCLTSQIIEVKRASGVYGVELNRPVIREI